MACISVSVREIQGISIGCSSVEGCAIAAQGGSSIEIGCTVANGSDAIVGCRQSGGGIIIGATFVCSVSHTGGRYLIFRPTDGKYILADGGEFYVLRHE